MTNVVNAKAPQAQVNGETMKAVRLYEYGGPENLKFEVNVPEPTLGADSVLVEATATSVNPIDWKIRLASADCRASRSFLPRSRSAGSGGFSSHTSCGDSAYDNGKPHRAQ